jgi:hypothetical protein
VCGRDVGLTNETGLEHGVWKGKRTGDKRMKERFKILTAGSIKMTVTWDMELCSDRPVD